MAFLLRLHYFLIIFYNNVEFFFSELTVSFSVDSPGGDDDVVLGVVLLEDSPVDSSDTADSICCSGIIGFGELIKTTTQPTNC